MAEGPPPRRVVLHVGAHKTASTHFTALVAQNAALLRQADMAAPHIERVRPAVTRVLSGLKGSAGAPAQAVARAGALADGAAGLLVMDENIIGVPRSLLGRGQIYPRAGLRLSRALRLFPGARVEVMLGLRDPASFVPASWAESLRSNEYRPFRDYLNGVPARRISWLHVICQMRRAVPGVRFTVWRFEDYRALAPRLVGIALGHGGGCPAGFQPLRTPVRVGLSARALDIVAAQARLRGRPPTPEAIADIMARFPKSPEHPAPAPWSDWEREVLSTRYAQDWERIVTLEDVHALAPSDPSLPLQDTGTEAIAGSGTHSSAG